MRRALILALGTYGTEGLSAGDREPLTAKLLELYRSDPDSGIHGAAEWALRKWGQREQLKELDAELSKLKDRGNRRWFVNSHGQTFAVIEGPVEFRMGSPPTEPNRNVTMETPRRMVIPRRFAIAAKEVTIEQCQRFRADQHPVRIAAPQPREPVQSRSRRSHVRFQLVHCRELLQLAERAGRVAQGPVVLHPRPRRTLTREGMTIPADVLERTGYRLPTEAEWEYACRAGAVTSRYYGNSLDLLDAYARYQANSNDHAWSCASLLPNDLGLFDMLGNEIEWVQDGMSRMAPKRRGLFNDVIIISGSVNEKNPRLLRGGAFNLRPAFVRSADRHRLDPAYRSSSYGLRPSMTYH